MAWVRTLFLVASCLAPLAAARAAPLHREDLVGAWRLVSIEYSGPRGPLEDPFYHAGCTGLLTYDAAGAMSVQIAGAKRPALSAATARAPAADDPDAKAKADAFDSYYAYFGTWELEGDTGRLVHHVSAALIPGEAGISYSQEATIEDGRLVLTNRQQKSDGAYVRRKTWERVAP